MTGRADPRIARGMAAQLARRRGLLAAGHAAVGWKIGMNARAAQRALDLDGPVVGHLTLATVIVPGRPHSLAAGTHVGGEPEVMIHLGAEVRAGADRETARRAIVGLGTALEVIDYDRPFDDLEAILAANVFHRAVAIGPTHPRRADASLAGVTARLCHNGAEVATVDAAVTAGDLLDVVRFVADFLHPFGEALRAGDRIIAGGLVPAVPVAAGDVVTVDLGPLGSLTVTFTA